MVFELIQTRTFVALGIIGNQPIVTKTLIPAGEFTMASWQYSLCAEFGKGFHSATLNAGSHGSTDDLEGYVRVTFGDHLDGFESVVQFSRINMAFDKNDTFRLCWRPYTESPVMVTFHIKRVGINWNVTKVEGHDELFDAIRYTPLLPRPWAGKQGGSGLSGV